MLVGKLRADLIFPGNLIQFKGVILQMEATTAYTTSYENVFTAWGGT